MSASVKRAIRSSIVSLVFLVLLSGRAHAQEREPPYITRWTIGSTGGVLSSASYTMAATAAQPNATMSSGTRYYMTGGVWTPHALPVWTYTEAPELDPDPLPNPSQHEDDPIDWAGAPDMQLLLPESWNLPPFPPLVPPDWPDTLGLPSVPTLTLQDYVSTTFSPVVSLTESALAWGTVISSGMLMPESMAGVIGLDISGFESGGDSNISELRLAGYTASEMAAELVMGIDVVLSYVRSVNEIGVIGPTMAAMVLGMAWIAFVASVKLIIKLLLLVIHMLLEFWRLLPFT